MKGLMAIVRWPEHPTVVLVLAFVATLLAQPLQAQERYVFWIGSVDSTEIPSSAILRYTVDSGDVDTLVHAADLGPTDHLPMWFSHITVDTLQNQIYWTDIGGEQPDGTVFLDAVRRATLDGEDPQVALGGIVCGLGGAIDIAVDAVGEILYWSERSDCFWNALYKWGFWDPIWTALPISGGYIVDGLDLDLRNEMVYWVSIDDVHYDDEPPPGIVRAPINDTASDEHIVTGCIGDIALAHMLSKIYWSPCNSNEIRRANLDGSSNQAVFNADGEVSHLAIDHKEGKIYWTEFETGKLSRANLDGTGADDLLTDLIGPTSLALSFGWDSRLSTAAPGAAGPDRVDLKGIYPNPVRESATVTFTLAEPAVVTLEIYDVLGRRVDVAASGMYPPGSYEVPWNTTGRAAGVYFCRVTAGGQARTMAFVVQP